MIETINLTKTFPNAKSPVLKGINLKIENGEFISLVGRSGSGKSTLLYILSTLDTATTGEVYYNSRKVSNIPKDEVAKIRNQSIGFVFQFHYLLQELSAIENVLLPARKAGKLEEKRPEAMALLKEVGLEGMEDRYPSELSGGEQQRVAIARALIMNPIYIFADEPTGNLDSVNGNMIIDLFKRINKEKGTTIIFVTHDQEFANMASRKITLVDGVLN